MSSDWHFVPMRQPKAKETTTVKVVLATLLCTMTGLIALALLTAGLSLYCGILSHIVHDCFLAGWDSK